MAKGQEKDILYRVAKFEVKPNRAQLEVLKRASANLVRAYNEAHAERVANYDANLAPLYKLLKEEKDVSAQKELRDRIRSVSKEYQVTLFDQINALTQKREQDITFGAVTRNWQEETLDTLNGALASFYALRKAGDFDARQPRARKEGNFYELLGRSGWSVKGGKFYISCKKLAPQVDMSWAIPEKQQQEIARGKVKKFTLYRDQPDLAKPGRFWVSLAYEMPMPPTKQFDPKSAVCVALGSSCIGVVSPRGEEVVELGRPDFHWIPLIREIDGWMKEKGGVTRDGKKVILEEGGSTSTRFHSRTRGSRRWQRTASARREMFRLMAAQNLLDRREVVAHDLLTNTSLDQVYGHGIHFVVTDMVVRSKKGKLADAKDKDRGGDLGLNWAAQNTGTLAYLVQWLTEKAKEHGGTVRKHKLPKHLVPREVGHGKESKIAMAKALRESFLSSR